MDHSIKTIILLLFCSCALSAQQIISLPEARFKTGDNAEWKAPAFNDTNWATLQTHLKWEKQGYDRYDGYAWYRFHFVLPSSLKDKAFWSDSLSINMARIDDVDETFFNGTKIGQIGSLPENAGGYKGKYAIERLYRIALTSELIKWDQDNVIAVRVLDDHEGGGIYGSVPYVKIMEPLDAIALTVKPNPENKDEYTITLTDITKKPANGKLTVVVTDLATNKSLHSTEYPIALKAHETVEKRIMLPNKRLQIMASFNETLSGKTLEKKIITAYILTPAPSLKPRINGATVVAAKPGAPFLYRIPVTGKRPLQFEVKALPKGLQVDLTTGIISGLLRDSGTYVLDVKAWNKYGKARQLLTIKAGSTLALTPPMGWNSWYCWGLEVSEEKVRASVKALQQSGLVDHGWNYINIDDGWNREPTMGQAQPNSKFKDMKALGDWLHANGLYFGIYSSPGSKTCGGYPGSYGHEQKDAAVFAAWGIDYLKYDWCSYSEVVKDDTTLQAFKKPYVLMDQALQSQKRAIVYSLCQYGMKDVWKWGSDVGGQCWRTDHDIRDTWESISAMVEKEVNLYPYAKPGHWNDPDIMVIGTIGGYKDEAFPTHLNPDEQYTHISLWSLLAAPLLIGCDVNKLDAFTVNLLSNDEVLSINQDIAGKQAIRKLHTTEYDVWVKALSDGSVAVGIVNTSVNDKALTLQWKDLLTSGNALQVRDVWRQQDIASSSNSFSATVPSHGTTLLRVWLKK